MPDDKLSFNFSDMVFSIAKAGAREVQLKHAENLLEEVLADMRKFEGPQDWAEKLGRALAQVKAAQ